MVQGSAERAWARASTRPQRRGRRGAGTLSRRLGKHGLDLDARDAVAAVMSPPILGRCKIHLAWTQAENDGVRRVIADKSAATCDELQGAVGVSRNAPVREKQNATFPVEWRQANSKSRFDAAGDRIDLG